VYAGEFKSYGRIAIIDHGGGIYAVYGNLEKISVKTDEKVKQGQSVGTVGISLISRDASLYFELRKDGKPQDPVAWLK
jgi:septal ring factor EnvC (AmiA/AmiB activator)